MAEHNCKQEKIIEEHHKTLYGNGRKGLSERVTIMQVENKIILAGIIAILGLMIKNMF